MPRRKKPKNRNKVPFNAKKKKSEKQLKEEEEKKQEVLRKQEQERLQALREKQRRRVGSSFDDDELRKARQRNQQLNAPARPAPNRRQGGQPQEDPDVMRPRFTYKTPIYVRPPAAGKEEDMAMNERLGQLMFRALRNAGVSERRIRRAVSQRDTAERWMANNQEYLRMKNEQRRLREELFRSSMPRNMKLSNSEQKIKNRKFRDERGLELGQHNRKLRLDPLEGDEQVPVPRPVPRVQNPPANQQNANENQNQIDNQNLIHNGNQNENQNVNPNPQINGEVVPLMGQAPQLDQNGNPIPVPEQQILDAEHQNQPGMAPPMNVEGGIQQEQPAEQLGEDQANLNQNVQVIQNQEQNPNVNPVQGENLEERAFEDWVVYDRPVLNAQGQNQPVQEQIQPAPEQNQPVPEQNQPPLQEQVNPPQGQEVNNNRLQNQEGVHEQPNQVVEQPVVQQQVPEEHPVPIVTAVNHNLEERFPENPFFNPARESRRQQRVFERVRRQGFEEVPEEINARGQMYFDDTNATMRRMDLLNDDEEWKRPENEEKKAQAQEQKRREQEENILRMIRPKLLRAEQIRDQRARNNGEDMLDADYIAFNPAQDARVLAAANEVLAFDISSQIGKSDREFTAGYGAYLKNRRMREGLNAILDDEHIYNRLPKNIQKQLDTYKRRRNLYRDLDTYMDTRFKLISDRLYSGTDLKTVMQWRKNLRAMLKRMGREQFLALVNASPVRKKALQMTALVAEVERLEKNFGQLFDAELEEEENDVFDVRNDVNAEGPLENVQMNFGEGEEEIGNDFNLDRTMEQIQQQMPQVINQMNQDLQQLGQIVPEEADSADLAELEENENRNPPVQQELDANEVNRLVEQLDQEIDQEAEAARQNRINQRNAGRLSGNGNQRNDNE